VKLIPGALQSLVAELSRLPGVGEKSALRYAVSLLRGGPQRIKALTQSLDAVGTEVAHCQTCFFWVDQGHCPLCEDTSRSATRMLVVRDAPDVLAFERFKRHPWRYHVLQGLLSPLSGVGPDQLRMSELIERVLSGGTEELILAFDATVEGDATALYIRDAIKKIASQVRVTRTALGLPAGASVEYLDASTLEGALSHRSVME
jgi:recombination protein RecR